MIQLPGIAAEITKAIGPDLTVKLLKARGGTELMVPRRARGTVLAALVGEPAAERVIEALGPGKVVLPCAHLRGAGARKLQAMQLLRAGRSLSEVALECDLHIRTVSNYRAELDAGADDPQGKLPL